MIESLKQCHRSVTVKEIGKASVKLPVIVVCIRNFLKENNLMTVKNIFIIADPCNITKYKRNFNNLKTAETNVKDHFHTEAKIDQSRLKVH